MADITQESGHLLELERNTQMSAEKMEIDESAITASSSPVKDESLPPTLKSEPGENNSSSPHPTLVSSVKKRPMVPSGQEGYTRKLRRLRLAVKNTVFLNGAICDEVLRTEEKLARAKEERRFLLRKLLQYQSIEPSLTAVKMEPQSTKQGKGSQDNSTNDNSSKSSKGMKRKAPNSAGGGHPSSSPSPMSTGASNHTSSPLSVTGASSLPGASTAGDAKKKLAGKDILATAKPKKGKGVSKKVIPPLMLDSLGRPVFPMVLGDVTLHSVGEIVLDRPNFHSLEAIYPAGYCITRMYASLKKFDSSCLWTCTISEMDEGPEFEIAAEDSSDIVFRASSPKECHSHLLRAFTKTRGTPMEAGDNSALEFFGLTHPVIQNLIQSCPGARKCPRYKWVKFEINKLETNENVAVGVSDPAVSLDAFKAHLIAMGIKPMIKSSPSEQSANLRTLLTKGQAGNLME